MDCIICAYPIDNKERLLCLTPCGHQEHVCSICFLRLRSLQRNFHCPTCKRQLDHVVCSFTEETTVSPNANLHSEAQRGGGRGRGKARDQEKEKSESEINTSALTVPAPVSGILYPAKTRFEDFEIWDDKINAPHYLYDARSQMFVPKFYFDTTIAKFWEFKCKICHTKRKDFKELRGHYFGEHKLSMCLLCIEFKQVFPSEQTVYTKSEYESHLRSGDHDGSKGHPNCEFCKKRFYDSTPLFQHLTRDHYNCHLCSQQGVRFKYFDKYPDLEAHFRRDHWICEDPACLQKGFMAFANDIDLMSHRVQYHPQLCIGNRTIPVQFKYRNSSSAGSNSSLNANTSAAATAGTASSPAEGESELATRTARFEGGIGGRAHNGEWQVEIEITTSDPRDPDRNLLRDDVVASTPSSSSAAASLNVIEDFPELPSSGPVSSTVALNKWVSLKATKQKKTSHANNFPALPSAPKKTGPVHAPGIIAPPRAPPAQSSSSSTAAALLEDFAAVSANGTRPATVADSLGSWATIKVDKRPAKAKKAAAPSAAPAAQKSENLADDEDFASDMQRALAESLNLKDDNPPLSAPKPKPTQPKPVVAKKAGVSNDWGDALKAVGMNTATKKKASGLTVLKANKSEADKKLIIGSTNKPAGSWVSLGGTGAKASREEQRVVVERDIAGFPSLGSSK